MCFNVLNVNRYSYLFIFAFSLFQRYTNVFFFFTFTTIFLKIEVAIKTIESWDVLVFVTYRLFLHQFCINN